MSTGSNAATLEARYRSCLANLQSRGQAHVLRWWDELDAAKRAHLLDELEPIPWARLDPLVESRVLREPRESTPTDLEPAPVYPRELEAAGIEIPRTPAGEPDVTLEIAPSYALDAADVKQRMTEPTALKPGESVYIS